MEFQDANNNIMKKNNKYPKILEKSDQFVFRVSTQNENLNFLLSFLIIEEQYQFQSILILAKPYISSKNNIEEIKKTLMRVSYREKFCLNDFRDISIYYKNEKNLKMKNIYDDIIQSVKEKKSRILINKYHLVFNYLVNSDKNNWNNSIILCLDNEMESNILEKYYENNQKKIYNNENNNNFEDFDNNNLYNSMEIYRDEKEIEKPIEKPKEKISEKNINNSNKNMKINLQKKPNLNINKTKSKSKSTNEKPKKPSLKKIINKPNNNTNNNNKEKKIETHNNKKPKNNNDNNNNDHLLYTENKDINIIKMSDIENISKEQREKITKSFIYSEYNYHIFDSKETKKKEEPKNNNNDITDIEDDDDWGESLFFDKDEIESNLKKNNNDKNKDNNKDYNKDDNKNYNNLLNNKRNRTKSKSKEKINAQNLKIKKDNFFTPSNGNNENNDINNDLNELNEYNNNEFNNNNEYNFNAENNNNNFNAENNNNFNTENNNNIFNAEINDNNFNAENNNNNDTSIITLSEDEDEEENEKLNQNINPNNPNGQINNNYNDDVNAIQKEKENNINLFNPKMKSKSLENKTPVNNNIINGMENDLNNLNESNDNIDNSYSSISLVDVKPHSHSPLFAKNFEQLQNYLSDPSDIINTVSDIKLIKDRIEPYNKLFFRKIYTSEKNKDDYDSFKKAVLDKFRLLVLIKTKTNKRFAVYFNEKLFSSKGEQNHSTVDIMSFIYSFEKKKFFQPKERIYCFTQSPMLPYLIKLFDHSIYIKNNFLSEKHYLTEKNKIYGVGNIYDELNGGEKEFYVSVLEIYCAENSEN